MPHEVWVPGVPYVPPSEAANVAAQMEITAAELAKRLAETQAE